MTAVDVDPHQLHAHVAVLRSVRAAAPKATQALDELERFLADLAGQLPGPGPSDTAAAAEVPPGPRIVARFVPQAWVNDYAIEIDDGHVSFDVTDQVLAMGRAAALAISDDSDAGDLLWQESAASVDHPHHGPFYVAVADAIAAYFETLDAHSGDGTDGGRLEP